MGGVLSETDKKNQADATEEKKVTLEDVDKMIKGRDPSIKTEFALEFEVWYSILREHTMKTHLIELSSQEVMAIVANCECKKDFNRTLDEQSVNMLNQIAKKVDDCIAENKYSENGVFVRFSHRSPKDAVFKVEKEKFAAEFQRISLHVMNEDAHLNKFEKNALCLNAALRGLVLTASKFQCIKSGEQAMEVAANSRRVFRDFKIGELEQGSDFKPFMIVREFYHTIEFEAEFRCFVLKNELTVITQYHSLCYVPFLVKRQHKIKRSIIRYWKETVHPLMQANKIESYVLDVAWVKTENRNDAENDDGDDDGDDDEKKEKQDYNWIVIELNPMCTNAGAELFDWTTEYELFLNAPTDFRVREVVHQMTPTNLEDGLDVFQEVVSFLREQHK